MEEQVQDPSFTLLNSSNDPKIVESSIEKSKIKCLVIPGGGVSGLVAYGALKECHIRGIWSMDEIENIYGTSAGALLAVMLALKYEWSIIDDYLIKRPWHQICDFNMYAILGSFEKRGIYDIRLIEGVLSPLFGGMDMPISITMTEFYEKTRIELHLFATHFEHFESVDISYKTHPDWTVVEAVYASAGLPICFAPLEKDGEHYIDGGIFLNYPLGPSLMREDLKPNEILGIRKKNIQNTNDRITTETSLFDYLLILLNLTFRWILSKTDPHTIQNEITITTHFVSIYDLYKMSTDESARADWIQQGHNFGKDFCDSMMISSSV